MTSQTARHPPSFEPSFYRSPDNTANTQTVGCLLWRRTARRSPVNREQILDVGMALASDRPGGTEILSRVRLPPWRAWLTSCTARPERSAARSPSRRREREACGRSWGLATTNGVSAATTIILKTELSEHARGEPIRVPLAGPGKLDDLPCDQFGYLNSRASGELKLGAHSVKRLMHGLNAFGLESESAGSGSWHGGVAECALGSPRTFPHATAHCRQIRDKKHRGGRATVL
jgi:hypothetical protein